MNRVEVEIDTSWFVAFGLGAWTLLTLAPTVLPSLPSGEIAIVSLLGALGVLGALALHEIARAVALRRCGVPVRRVTLLLFGGITDHEGDHPPSPEHEALAAAMALLASAAAAATCLGVAALFSDDLDRGAPGAVLVAWFAAANAGVVALNLLPAYPLDGGRIVRAAVWRVTGDLGRSTRWLSLSAEIFGWFAIVLGVTLVFAAGRAGMVVGMWTTIGGWFLASSAAQAYESFARQRALAVEA